MHKELGCDLKCGMTFAPVHVSVAFFTKTGHENAIF
jgi:hypothetical protein